jgi:hypothetical protein
MGGRGSLGTEVAVIDNLEEMDSEEDQPGELTGAGSD